MPGEIVPAGSQGAHGPQSGLRASHADRDRTAELLRVAAGDGRLTAEELDERLELALSARTIGELARLTADLPAVSVSVDGVVVAEVKDVLRIDQRWSPVRREGRWVVPRRLELFVEWCEVTLDFTQAVITHDTLLIDLDMDGKTLTLITGPGVVVDTDGLTVEFARVRNDRAADQGGPTALRVELVGRKRHGRIVVRPSKRPVGRWLRRRPPALPTGG
ncbi:DUF1707 SHOCT-like domain-containing protein [Kitasatospora brasiliensis]|uniref:DUF1707 SHOCT-like domain-containing protein n=1 Tax=Kitasatospora brasiliensis TaxID=3058040 RepID=UPI00292F3F8E|nr:DUF1707 domain-containing protein [Kitasatospora sp. K002]